jgi:hypothetical protein
MFVSAAARQSNFPVETGPAPDVLLRRGDFGLAKACQRAIRAR